MNTPDWLNWARKMQAIAQIGLTYAENPYDRERYQQLRELAEEIFGVYSGKDEATITEWFDLQPGYATPKVDVRSACFRDGKLLLVRERNDGRWCLPGGWADVGDVPSEAAAREVYEEAGFTCVPRKVIGVFDANRQGEPLSACHAYKIIFLCQIIGGAGQSNHETLGVDFFARDAIPPLSEARTSLGQVIECFAHLGDATRATQFD